MAKRRRGREIKAGKDRGIKGREIKATKVKEIVADPNKHLCNKAVKCQPKVADVDLDRAAAAAIAIVIAHADADVRAVVAVVDNSNIYNLLTLYI